MNEYLTSALPGIGGALGEDPADFFVEEIPLYQPCGSGEHLYLTVEKRGLTTYELLNRVARRLGIRERDLGYAGLKDARAVTRQTISIPGVRPEEVSRFDIPGVRVLAVALHTNKLRPGHLSGNRFVIRLSGTGENAVARAAAILDVLEDLGVPNRFGRQRYGLLGNSHRIGNALLRKDYRTAITEIVGDPEQIEHPGWREAAQAFREGQTTAAIPLLPRHCRNERLLLECLARGESPEKCVLDMPRKLLRLYLSACQSALFDRIVLMRLESLERIWPGDLAYKHINGACFLVEDPGVEQARADLFEISSSGLLFGFKTRLAQGQAGLLEQALLDKEKLTLNDFRVGRGLSMEGARRPLRVPLLAPKVVAAGDGIQVAFQLPKGSYATAVLHELMKTEIDHSKLAEGLQ